MSESSATVPDKADVLRNRMAMIADSSLRDLAIATETWLKKTTGHKFHVVLRSDYEGSPQAEKTLESRI